MMRRTAASLLCLTVFSLLPLGARASALEDRVEERRQARLRALEVEQLESTSEVRSRSLARQREAERRARLAAARTTASRATSHEEEVISLVNVERVRAGLPPLRKNDLLAKAAFLHAQDMNVRGYFNHVSPEGETPETRVKYTGYLDIDFQTCRCRNFSYAVGENIADGQLTAEQVMLDWMNSPTHRANILSADFTEIGVGFWRNVWVQNFGRVTKW